MADDLFLLQMMKDAAGEESEEEDPEAHEEPIQDDTSGDFKHESSYQGGPLAQRNLEEVPKAAKHTFITAIDLGTKYSGYAFQQSTLDGGATAEDEIVPFVNWGGTAIYNNYKTPTCILLDKDGSLRAFGQEAIDKFTEMEREARKDVMFFELFKMTLYSEIRRSGRLDRNYNLTAKGGQEYPAIKVFSRALQHLKMHFYGEIRKRVGVAINDDDVLWVLTVPAIWDDSAKDFMREAAYEADLITPAEQDRLIIALEPEAAALHCRTLKFSGFQGGSASGEFEPPKSGDKYLVVDAGGGTVDITAHIITGSKEVREIDRAQGGPHGGSQVDELFIKFMEDVFQKDFIDEVKETEAPELVAVVQNFEMGKRKCGFKELIENEVQGFRGEAAEEESPLAVSLPYDFCQLYAQKKGMHPKDAIKAYGKPTVKWRGGCLKIQASEARKFFEPVIQRIVETLQELILRDTLMDVKIMYLVGGFSDCPLMRHEIAKAFPNVRVQVPVDAGLAVVKGAVRFGRNPSQITERVMRHTYGTSYCPVFDANIHDERRKRYLNDNYHCMDCFHTFVKVGQSVKFGDVVEHTFAPLDKMARQFTAKIYASTREVVQYADDPDCYAMTEITVLLPPCAEIIHMHQRPVKLVFYFGRTELKVKAADETTGQFAETSVSFLSLGLDQSTHGDPQHL